MTSPDFRRLPLPGFRPALNNNPEANGFEPMAFSIAAEWTISDY